MNFLTGLVIMVSVSFCIVMVALMIIEAVAFIYKFIKRGIINIYEKYKHPKISIDPKNFGPPEHFNCRSFVHEIPPKRKDFFIYMDELNHLSPEIFKNLSIHISFDYWHKDNSVVFVKSDKEAVDIFYEKVRDEISKSFKLPPDILWGTTKGEEDMFRNNNTDSFSMPNLRLDRPIFPSKKEDMIFSFTGAMRWMMDNVGKVMVSPEKIDHKMVYNHRSGESGHILQCYRVNKGWINAPFEKKDFSDGWTIKPKFKETLFKEAVVTFSNSSKRLSWISEASERDPFVKSIEYTGEEKIVKTRIN